MNFSIITSSCINLFIYGVENPDANINFIDYKTPFVGSWFPDDEQYVSLCENYDDLILLESRLGEPINITWEKNTGSKWSLSIKNYPVMFLGNIETHWLHERYKNNLIRKFKGRLEFSKNYEHIFLWSE